MIDDIVLLPRRLTQFKRDAEVSSELICTPPLSSISRLVGYEVPDDTWALPFGIGFNLPTGVDSWFRFKLIENTISGIVEYFCLAESPLDILRIRKSKNTKVYCITVAITDPHTFKQHRYVLWEHVRALMRYEIEDNVNDSPIESAIADELRAFAEVYGCPEIFGNMSSYPSGKDIVRISEINPNIGSGVDSFLKTVSNIKALSEIYTTDSSIHAPDPTEVFRDTNIPDKWTDMSLLKRSTVLPHMIWGPVCIKEILYLVSPRFELHGFQRGFTTKPLPGDTEISFTADQIELFSIIEYIQTIPYGEFELTVKADKTHKFVCYNPFNMNVPSRTLLADHSRDAEPEVVRASENIHETMGTTVAEIVVARSWAEEAYITFRYTDGTSRRFYVDLAVHALGSRSLFRDYECSVFTMC